MPQHLPPMGFLNPPTVCSSEQRACFVSYRHHLWGSKSRNRLTGEHGASGQVRSEEPIRLDRATRGQLERPRSLVEHVTRLRRRLEHQSCLPSCDPTDMSLTNTHADKGDGRRARRWTKRKPTRLSRCTMCRRSRATHSVIRTGDAKTSNFSVVGRFLLRSRVESTLGFPPKGVASNPDGPCLHDSSSSQPAAAISVALSIDRTTSSQRTTKHLSASSRAFALFRRTSLPNDAPHVAAKHPAVELTVAMGVTTP
jgi:hypothetical protein